MLYGHCLQSHERTSDRALREASTEKTIHKQAMVQRCQDTVSYARSILRYDFISLSYNSADAGGSPGWRDRSAPQGRSGTQFCSIPLLCSIVLVGIVFNYMVKTWSLPHECSSLWEGQKRMEEHTTDALKHRPRSGSHILVAATWSFGHI